MNKMEKEKSRFDSYSVEKEKSLSEKKHGKNTNYSTNFALRLLQTFCEETIVDFNGEYPKENLPVILKRFYMCSK